MTAAVPSPDVVLKTSIPHLELRSLVARDAAAFFRLVQNNRQHLTQFGNYLELVGSTAQEVAAQLGTLPVSGTCMGIWVSDCLAGRVDLNSVAPGTFVLGYWLGQAHTGHGYATESCRAILAYARRSLGATDFWAGVTHGNQRSVALLSRLGFNAVETLPDRTRFHLGPEPAV